MLKKLLILVLLFSLKINTTYLYEPDILKFKLLESTFAKKVLANEYGLNSKDEFGNNALIHSIFDTKETIQALIDKGIDINAQNANGYTPLMYAAGEGYANLVELLLANGADVNLRDSLGKTALIIGARGKCDAKVIKLLLSHGADVNAQDVHGNTALLKAIKQNNTKVTRILLNQGANFNLKNHKGNNAWFEAAFYRYLNIMELLLEHGFDINTRDDYGTNALCYLGKLYCFNNNHYKDVINFLITNKIDLNAQDINGTTALMFAVQSQNLELTYDLLHYGADVNIKDKFGKTALSYILEKVNEHETSSWFYQKEELIATLLLLHKLNTNNDEGNRALITAILKFRSTTVRLIVNNGADVNYKDENGKSVLEHAINHFTLKYPTKDDLEKLQVLLDNKANVNIQDKDGNTPLMLAISLMVNYLIEPLIKAGYDFSIKNAHGKTALDIAKKCGNVKAAKIILKYINN